MTLLSDNRLGEAGLTSLDERAGFRVAMAHRALRSATSLPMKDEIAQDADRMASFLRGAGVARHWRAIRSKHREVKDAQTEFGVVQQNRRIRDAAYEHLVEAIAREDGFPDAHALLAHHIGGHVAYGERQYILRDAVAFYHADGPNGILAPVHSTSIRCGGLEWTSVEAIYQAHKHSDEDVRRLIRLAPDPLSAKAVAKGFPTSVPSMHGRFGHHRRVAMARAQLLRAEQDAAFTAALLATGTRSIVEHTNDPASRDTDWGTHGVTVARGWNTQGRILEHVRTALRNESIVPVPQPTTDRESSE